MRAHSEMKSSKPSKTAISNKQTVEDILLRNVVESELDDALIDENMLDYRLDLTGENPEPISEQIKKQTREILDLQKLKIHSTPPDRHPNGASYVMLEKTEELPGIISENLKNGSIRFYNPLQNTATFEAEFFKSAARPQGDPFLFREHRISPPSDSNPVAKSADQSTSGSASKLPTRSAIQPSSCSTGHPDSSLFPGQLHLAITSINEYLLSSKNCSGISLRIETPQGTRETPLFPESRTIRLNLYESLPITRKGPLSIRVLLVRHRSPDLFRGPSKRVVSECLLTVENPLAIQNKLLNINEKWKSYRSRNILKNVRGMLMDRARMTGTLNAQVSYITERDLSLVHAPRPFDLFSLTKWLSTRQRANDLLFAGYVHMCRGRDIWSRVYVKWYGYNVFVFDGSSKRLQDKINVVDAEISCTRSPEKIVGFKMGQRVVELQFDTVEKFEGCQEALTVLFPPVRTRRIGFPVDATA